MFAYFVCQRGASQGDLTHSFEVTMDDLKVVKISHAGQDLSKLRVLDEQE